MQLDKNQLIAQIGRKARRKMAELSRQYVCGKAADREEIQAGIQFERWLADTCDDCLSDSPDVKMDK